MRIAIYIIFFLGSFKLFAQADNRLLKRQYGIAAHTFMTRYSCGLGNSLVFTVTRKKHQFEIGPKYIFNDSVKAVSQIGGEINYRYYPNGLTQRFDLFFLLNMDCYHMKNEFYEMYKAHLTKYNQMVNYTALNAGFGIQTNLWKGFYLSSNIAGGIMVESKSGHSAPFYYHHSDLKLGFIAEVSLGFRFGNSTK